MLYRFHVYASLNIRFFCKHSIGTSFFCPLAYTKYIDLPLKSMISTWAEMKHQYSTSVYQIGRRGTRTGSHGSCIGVESGVHRRCCPYLLILRHNWILQCWASWVCDVQCSLWGAMFPPQLRSTTRPFAQWNLILAHLQHSKFNILYILHGPWNALLVVCPPDCAIAWAPKQCSV